MLCVWMVVVAALGGVLVVVGQAVQEASIHPETSTGKGCCYNGGWYLRGQVVEKVPQLCLDLVCVARPHALTHTIVPVNRLPHLCPGLGDTGEEEVEEECEGCMEARCVDGEGLVQEETTSLLLHLCLLCRCAHGRHTCHNLLHNCNSALGPVANFRSKEMVEGSPRTTWGQRYQHRPAYHHYQPQSYQYHSEPAYKYQQKPYYYHQHQPAHVNTVQAQYPIYYQVYWLCFHGGHDGVQWETEAQDPCLVYACKGRIVSHNRKTCPAAPHPNCRPQHTGACCPTWDCTLSGCVDQRGGQRQHGARWTLAHDPCTEAVCKDGRVWTRRVECPPAPAPHCAPQPVPAQCCSSWDCSGRGKVCEEGGQQYQVDQEWQVEVGGKCSLHRCTEQGVHTLPCPALPRQPSPSCLPRPGPQGCCPVWSCSGCNDQNGVYHEHNTMWTLDHDPCLVELCLAGEVWAWSNCSGCVDQRGDQRQHGARWTLAHDPCTEAVCKDGRVWTRRVECPPAPAPHCAPQPVPAQCCSSWDCSGREKVCEEGGQQYQVEQEWQVEVGGRCSLHRCTEQGVHTLPCPALPRQPSPSCLPRPGPQGCCPVWSCSGCHDQSGVYHEHNTMWTPDHDPCLLELCLAGEVWAWSNCRGA